MTSLVCNCFKGDRIWASLSSGLLLTLSVVLLGVSAWTLDPEVEQWRIWSPSLEKAAGYDVLSLPIGTCVLGVALLLLSLCQLRCLGLVQSHASPLGLRWCALASCCLMVVLMVISSLIWAFMAHSSEHFYQALQRADGPSPALWQRKCCGWTSSTNPCGFFGGPCVSFCDVACQDYWTDAFAAQYGVVAATATVVYLLQILNLILIERFRRSRMSRGGVYVQIEDHNAPDLVQRS